MVEKARTYRWRKHVWNQRQPENFGWDLYCVEDLYVVMSVKHRAEGWVFYFRPAPPQLDTKSRPFPCRDSALKAAKRWWRSHQRVYSASEWRGSVAAVPR